MRARQLSFLPRPEIEHGGDIRKGRRKVQRPFDPKQALHVTLRSSRARGEWSLLRESRKWKVHELLKQVAEQNQIRVYRYANVGNHIHLLIQARTRARLQAFLREFAGVIAVMVTGAVKGSPSKFWDALAWSKIVGWGTQFRNAVEYIMLNFLEGHGRRDRDLLIRLQRDGYVIIGKDPGS